MRPGDWIGVAIFAAVAVVLTFPIVWFWPWR